MQTKIKTSTLATVLCGAAMLAGTSAQAATYKSAYGYQISSPKGWTTAKSVAGTEIMFLSPTRESVNVVSQTVRKSATLEQARVQTIADLRRMWTDYKVLGESMTTLGGQRAFSLTSSYKMNMPVQTVQIHQVFVIRKGRLFCFTCTAREATYAKFARDFQSTLASVRWTK